MKTTKLKVFFRIILLLSNNFLLANDDVLFSRVEQYLNNLETLSADFVQTTYSNKEQVSSGTLYISKPKMARFDYLKPRKITMILKDDQVVHHSYELNETSYIRKSNYFIQLLSGTNIKLQKKGKVSLFNNKVYLKIEKKIDDISTNITMTFTNDPMVLQEVEIDQNYSEKYHLSFSS